MGFAATWVILASCACAASAQSGFIWSEISTDGIHWHTTWWPSTCHTEFIRVRATWSNIPGALGFASSQINVCLANAHPGDVIDLAIPDPLNGLNQTLTTQDAGGRLCIVSTSPSNTWINPFQNPPLNNAGFDSAKPITLFTATLPPTTTNFLSVSLFLNSAAGRALQIYISPEGSTQRLTSSAVAIQNAAFFSTGTGCAFMDQPVDQTIHAGDTAVFTATFGVPGNYQWRKDGLPLAETDKIRGVNTIRLTISPTRLEDRGRYDCFVANVACSEPSSSTAAQLTVMCLADINADDTVDMFDYLDFVASFGGGASASDFNHDATIDIFDYLDFLIAFNQGC